MSPELPKFWADEMVSLTGCKQLRARGVNIVHAVEANLMGRSDAEAFAYAIRENRIVVTLNYRDFAPLIETLKKTGVDFPGVLFLSTSIPPADIASHVTLIEEFAASPKDVKALQNTFRWIPDSGDLAISG